MAQMQVLYFTEMGVLIAQMYVELSSCITNSMLIIAH